MLTSSTSNAAGRTFLRIEAVKQKTGLSTSSIYALIEDDKFPKPVPLSERRVAWLQSEIELWMAGRIDMRDAGAKTMPVKRRRLRRERGNG
jgi:prophage regulatory protein